MELHGLRSIKTVGGFSCAPFLGATLAARVARLKAAVINIFGKSIKALLKIVAREVLEFYLCAEQKALRELASREPASAMVMRARTLYWDSEAAPREPFMDRWSVAEFGKRDWLMKMADAFV